LSTGFGAQWLATACHWATGWKQAPEGPNGALDKLGPGGGEDVFGFFAGEFVAFAEGFGKAVDRIQLGADQVVGALA
jgi:hypothetical protein